MKLCTEFQYTGTKQGIYEKGKNYPNKSETMESRKSCKQIRKKRMGASSGGDLEAPWTTDRF